MPGMNCSISLAVLRMAECEASASFRRPLRDRARRPAGSRPAPPAPRRAATGSAMQEIEPFWTPWLPAPRMTRGSAPPGTASTALRVAHQRLGAGAGREAHLDAARGVRRCQKRLRPGRVVAIDKRALGAIDRKRLGIGDRPLIASGGPSFLDRALGQHAGAARLRADQHRQRVQRRKARDADRRLELGKAARRRLGRVGRQQRRARLRLVTCAWLAGVRRTASSSGRTSARPDRGARRLARASPASARERAGRRSLRGTSMSTSILAIVSSGRAIASAATSRSRP